jgi:hypothetical protein
VNARAKLAADDPRHGTTNGYDNLGCRCSQCREAKTTANKEWRHRTGYSMPMEMYLRSVRGTAAPHGTETRYTAGCRCDQCRHAANNERWRRRQANLEASRAYDREYKRRVRANLP